MSRFVAYVLLLGLSAAALAETTLPQYNNYQHLGVVTCAGSTCHGANKPSTDTSILQNEFLVWQREDKHAKAYKVLLSDQSKRIARNLGLKEAHTAKVCLDCHTDNAAEGKRGKRFQISDGVSCEACHGGAEKWMDHVSGQKTHQENIANGLYPTENPLERAKLCLSCHFGDTQKPITHRIMGAGHPRLSGFELDAFTATEPAHFKVDADYIKRKGDWSGAQAWAIGQMVAVDTFLGALTDPKRNHDGAFPELTLFDCHSCHHSMDNARWTPRQGTGLQPGIVRLNDSNLLMLRHVITLIDPGLGKTWRQKSLNLHRAASESREEMVRAAQELQALVRDLQTKLTTRTFSVADVKTVLSAIAAEGASGEYLDYAGAEQSLMAIDSLLNALERQGGIAKPQLDTLRGQLDGMYKTLEKEGDSYKPALFVTQMQALQTALK